MESVDHAISRVLHAWELQEPVPPVLKVNFCTTALVTTTAHNTIQTEDALLHVPLDSTRNLILHALHVYQAANNAQVPPNVQHVLPICIHTWDNV